MLVCYLYELNGFGFGCCYLYDCCSHAFQMKRVNLDVLSSVGYSFGESICMLSPTCWVVFWVGFLFALLARVVYGFSVMKFDASGGGVWVG